MLPTRPLLVGTLLLALSACSSAGAEPGAGSGAQPAPAAAGDRLDVATGFYPLQFVAERVGGDAVRVEPLAPAGAEPHDLELGPQQVAALSEADLVLHLEGFQPAVDRAVEQQAADAALDAASVTPLVDGDPHVWLDPVRMAALADAVAQRLAAAAPEQAAAVRGRADALRAELTELARELRAGLADCERREVVTSHTSFGYLARAYGLTQVGIAGLSPHEDPSPARLAELTELAEAAGVTTVFFEEAVGPELSEALAREVGARAEVLSPLETQPEGGDYLSGMRAVLASLRTALGCS